MSGEKQNSALAVLVAVVLATIAVIVWWNYRTGDAPYSADPVEESHAAEPVTMSEVPAPAERTVSSETIALERAQVDTTAAPASVSRKEAVMRGRATDEQGNPLRGVAVRLRGWIANHERMAAHERDHGEVVWQDPDSSTTGADGQFEVRFQPPPPYQFVLELALAGRSPVNGRWGEIAPGTIKEFGDVVLPRGVPVSGRVVDTDGAPRADVMVRLDRYNRADRPRGELAPRAQASARTAADGTFRMHHPLAAATWNFTLRGAQLAEPRTEVVVAAPQLDLQITVQQEADVVAIRGMVVDESGAPVRGARVDPVGRRGGGWMTSSSRDGTFVLEKRAAGDPEGSFRLQVEHDRYEHLTTEQAYEWGADDVRIVLRAGLDVEIHVTRASDGTPVEEYGARLLPRPDTTNRRSSSDTAIRGGWQHDDGRLVVASIRRGIHWLFVEPRSDSGLGDAGPFEITVSDGPPPVVAVQLPPRVEQTIAVKRSDGTAVSGTRIELVQALDGSEIGPSDQIRGIDDLIWGGRKGRLVDQATTDTSGSCSVAGAAERTCTLRAFGDGHPPIIRSGVLLGGDPIEMIVPTGATLRVTLQPLELLADLREQAGLPRTEPLEESEQGRLPGVALLRTVGDQRERHPPGPGNTAIAFDDRGVAELRGVAGGTWDLQLVSSTGSGARSYSTGGETVRTGVVLDDGEQTDIALDMRDARPGRLRASITLDGKPYQGHVELTTVTDVLRNGVRQRDHRYTQSDAEGRLEVLLRPGTWRAGAWLSLGSHGVRVDAESVVHVAAAQVAEARFDARTGRAAVRLLRPDGAPAAGVRVALRRDGEPLPAGGPATDAEGRTTIVATPGPAVPAVLIRSLRDAEARRAYIEQHSNDPAAIDRMTIQLPPIGLTEGEPEEVEIQLPADWDR